ncbi:PXA domain-containing protein [Lasiosphaeria ovina]|uniref:PXA domain-containing protein n=1 Tax=Lasiosphaeria ovina TaxID=92902 RepID=A0AAE0TTU1_9PEZI|nr:PXA domain-containing protein [Lasiosphaeria ovina]
MTTAAAQGPTRAPTPRPKATLSAPELTAATASASNPRPIQPSGLLSGSGRRGGGAAGAAAGAPADGLSDRATASLIRRTLCPQQLVDKAKNTTPAPIEDLLPPLTSRNDVDLQLYALIAIILREFVQNWYSKITPDETFVAEIVQIIAHCTRALEQRLRKVDLESLLLDEFPDLLDRHITAYRTAHDPVAQPPVVTDPREIYHSLYSLPALSPVPRPSNPDSVAQQAENEVVYRQLLVNAVLPVLLPTEDLENECLTALVGQIFSELIIGNVVANKLSEPWLLWEVIIIGAGVIGRRRAAGRPAPPGPGAGPLSRGSKDGRRGFSIQALFWTVLQWGFVAASLLRAIVAMLITSRTIPRRPSRNAPVRDEHALSAAAAHHRPDIKLDPIQAADSYETETNTEPPKTPMLAFRLWAALSNLAELDVRMPWLCGTLSILQWIAMTGPGRMANVDGVIDR